MCDALSEYLSCFLKVENSRAGANQSVELFLTAVMFLQFCRQAMERMFCLAKVFALSPNMNVPLNIRSKNNSMNMK